MKIKFILILLLSYGFSLGQSDTLKIYHINDFRIEAVTEIKENGIIKKKTILYKNLNTVSIVNDTFVFSTNGNLNIQKFAGKEIKTISIKEGNYFMPAAGYSALGGFAVGFLVGSLAKDEKGEGHPSYSFSESGLPVVLGLMLGVTSGIVGGILVANTPYYKDFNLGKNGFDNNSEELKKIITKYKNN
ncbi:MAG: hypothetical protein M3R36_01885 [Bacteroidota bacterium]|nr:hypothetical protein [Bacteroidota bacterium]